jgi:ABC-type branched-subunit amino acid transport system ATPase component
VLVVGILTRLSLRHRGVRPSRDLGHHERDPLCAWRVPHGHVSLVPEGGRVCVRYIVEENLRLGTHSAVHKTVVQEQVARVCQVLPHLAERRLQLAGFVSGADGHMVAIGGAFMAGRRLLLVDDPVGAGRRAYRRLL